MQQSIDMFVTEVCMWYVCSVGYLIPVCSVGYLIPVKHN